MVARESMELSNERIDALRELLPEPFAEGKIDLEKHKATLSQEMERRT